MPRTLKNVIGCLQRLALGRDSPAACDEVLLARFARDGDEAAFAAILERYGGLVYGICRRILGHAQNAEDAFQATFLVLAHKAGRINKGTSLRSWLHGVAYRVAARLRDTLRRRAKVETQVVDVAESTMQAALGPDVLLALHEEIARLPESLRRPVLLCYLEGKTNAEAARELGCPRGTIATHLARARVHLRVRLARRGLALPAAALASALAPKATAALPAKVMQTTLAAAKACAAGKLAVPLVSAEVLALVKGMVRTMAVTRYSLIGALVLGLVMAVAGAAALGAGDTPGLVQAGPAGAKEKIVEKEKAAPDDDEQAMRRYIDQLRAAVKAGNNQEIYNLAIMPMFRKSVRWAARTGKDELVVELYQLYEAGNTAELGGASVLWAARHNDAETLEILLGRGVDVNGVNAHGRTALHEAIRWGSHNVSLLLAHKAKADVASKAGETPLMLAAAARSPESVTLLLEKGVRVNAKDERGRTPLMYAAEGGRAQNAKLLIDAGAEIDAKDQKGRTALDLAKAPVLEFGGLLTKERLAAHAKESALALERLRQLLRDNELP